MMDVEFSHPMKALGEIFEVAARPFRVDVYNGKSSESSNLLCRMYKERIEPSLEYGAAEFYFMTIEVRLQRCVAFFVCDCLATTHCILESPSKILDLS